MKSTKGFGLVSILITLGIVIGIAWASYNALQNVGTVNVEDEKGENASIKSILDQAESAKNAIEKRDTNALVE